MSLVSRPLRALWPLALALSLSACGDDPAPVEVRPVLVVQASSGDLGYEAFAGEVHAREEPQLAFRIGGKISRRLVDAGARVKAGQALAELDPADVRLQSEADRAALASAQADLALAQSELQRYKNLVDKQLVSRSLYDNRVAGLRAAESRVRQARAQLSASGNQVAYAVLRAPSDGVIAQRLAEAGQVVAAGQAVFVLAVDGEREVVISVPEQSIGRFPVGRDLAVELWAEPGKRFPGKLREISPSADAQTRTFLARVGFDTAGAPVELGQSARVYAQTATGSGMRLPLSALTQSKGRPAVWVVDPATSRLRLTPVRTGAFGEDGVPIQSGLTPTDWVVAAGAHLVLEGEKIAPIDRDNRPVRLAGAAASAKPSGN
ncbi:MAG: efflux RND transporter periplasmic adaptor subunit [Gammaproteobacteria bacterium]|nr:efflux RND transporter periplasmic adaptor subunit [Gammaproteobacteria bacterium]